MKFLALAEYRRVNELYLFVSSCLLSIFQNSFPMLSFVVLHIYVVVCFVSLGGVRIWLACRFRARLRLMDR